MNEEWAEAYTDFAKILSKKYKPCSEKMPATDTIVIPTPALVEQFENLFGFEPARDTLVNSLKDQGFTLDIIPTSDGMESGWVVEIL